ncbi:MAG: OsmC family protein [Bacteroidota bacterium]
MEIRLQRQNQAFHFEAQNEHGNTISFDSHNPEIGGQGKGFGPMETVAAAIGACSAIDIGVILGKQKQEIKDFRIKIDAQRAKDQVPKVFTEIHITYELHGEIEEAKAQRAIELSISKYCSVSKMIEKTANIRYSLILNPTS